MKIVVTGKGGAGKTTVAAVLARTLAASGRRVVALDADPNPNLGIALGLGVEQTERLDAVVNLVFRQRAAHQRDHEEGGHDHPAEQFCPPRPERSAEDMVGATGVVAPDGVVLVETGRIERPSDGCMCCGSHGATRRMFAELGTGDDIVVADLEPGVQDLAWAAPSGDDVVLVVTEPSLKSVEVGRLCVGIARELGVTRIVVVANRLESSEDAAMIAGSFADLPVTEVPEDEQLFSADRAGMSPLDAGPAGPAVLALQGLAAVVTGLVAAG